jgi:hypothetical protein
MMRRKTQRAWLLAGGIGAFAAAMALRTESHSIPVRAAYAGLAFALFASAIFMFKKRGGGSSNG